MKISIVTFINIYLNRKCPQKVMSGEPKGASHLNHLIIIIKEWSRAGVHVGRCIAHPLLTTATKVDPMIGNGCCSVHVHVMRLYVRGFGGHPLGCLGSLWVQRLPPKVDLWSPSHTNNCAIERYWCYRCRTCLSIMISYDHCLIHIV